uniref:DNA polymerase n=1 Tax=Thermofilum pendens TaxID=2269 RepID=A0A7C4D5W6_THEPE
MVFYDDEKETLVEILDRSNHKPYLLTDLSPEEVVQRYPEVVRHRGFFRIDIVEKYDALEDRLVLMSKIEAQDPLSIGGSPHSIREILKGHAWEAKIKYHHCYIYDRSLIPGMPYEIVDGELKLVRKHADENLARIIEELYSKDKVLAAEALEWAEVLSAPVPRIKRVAVDIEVESPRDRVPNAQEANYRVIAFSYCASDGRKGVFLLKREEGLQEEVKVDGEVVFFDDEKSLIEAIFNLLSSYPLVITFNGDNFDLPYLYNRALKLGVPEEKNPIEWSPKMEYAGLKRGLHIDLYKFFTNRSMRVYAFGNKYREGRTLDEISTALLGKGKVQRDSAIASMSYGKLAEYSLRDAELTYELTAFNDDLVINLIVMMMRISKLPIEDLTRHNISAWIRNMLYYEHRQRGWLIPNPEDIVRKKGQVSTRAIIKGKKYMGAIVLNPLPGVYFNVVVVDFASLYPSVIKTWNLSYETVRCSHEDCKSNSIPGTTHWVCRRRRGMMSSTIGILRDLRVYVFKRLAKTAGSREERQKAEVVQSALKVFLNASYGVFGADSFPLYCPPLAESTAALGRYSILRTMEKAVSLGIPVVYGDTDSLFLWSPSPQAVEELVQSVLSELQIDLSVDKEYAWVVFSRRKKNYLGMLADGQVDVKGLTGKKRNTPDYVKEIFREVIEALSSASDVAAFEKSVDKVKDILRDSIDDLKRGKVPLNLLAFKVALTKPLSSYTKTTPQHVKAARLLITHLKKLGIERSIEVGDVISYVKTSDKMGVKPVELARIDEVDHEKYIEIIRTTLEQVLEALDIRFEELLEKYSIEYFAAAQS